MPLLPSRQHMWCLSAALNILGSLATPVTAAVSPHTVDNPAAPIRPDACTTLPVPRVEGFSGPPSPDLSLLVSGCCARSVGKSAGASTLPSQLFAYVSALRPCRPCLEHAKNCSFVSWSGPACPPVSPARAPAAACCPSLPACFLPSWPRPSLPSWSSPLPLLLALCPFSFPALRLSPLCALSLSPSPSPCFSAFPSSFGSRAAFRRRPRSSCAFGLVSGSSVRSLLLCCAWAVGGLLPCLCCLFPRCLKLVSSTVTEH